METAPAISREEINARHRENYRLRMENPAAKEAHRKNCREYVHARRERDPAFRQKTNAEAAAYRERQRAKILAEIAAGLRPAPVRLPKQTPEERRIYRQQWCQENKERIREKNRIARQTGSVSPIL